jgi:hypothetical protein
MMAKNWEMEFLTSLGMTVGKLAGVGGFYHPPSALRQKNYVYKTLFGQ